MEDLFYFLSHLFDTVGFPPRWRCGTQWSPALGYLHIISDLLIFLAYISIPILLIYFTRNRKEMPFVPIFWLFAAFISLCGLSHLIDANLFWHPWYRFWGLVKLLTAIVSLITAFYLMRTIPWALSLPLKASLREHFEFIVQSTGDAIVTYDLDLMCTTFNHGAEKMFGYTAAEMIGQSILILVPETGDYKKENTCNVDIVKRGGVVNLFETQRTHKSGKLVTILTTYSKLINERGQTIGICTVSKDLTKRKNLETQVAEKVSQLADKNNILKQLNSSLKIKNEEISSFAHAASHDLKSPLRIITNFSYLLQESLKGIATPETEKLIKTIYGQSIQMGCFIDDLSAYFQLGSEKFAYEQINCLYLVENIIRLLEKPDGLAFEVTMHLEPLWAPRLPLQIVLQNLIANAIKHHHNPEQGHIIITAERVKKAVIFKIQDDGPGIAPVYHEKIFQVFQTLEPREMRGGSGIGLSLVKRALQRYGGTIKVHSKLGQGSVFEVVWLIDQKNERIPDFDAENKIDLDL